MRCFEDDAKNTRQIMGQLKASQKELEFPTPQEQFKGGPTEINIYTDGR